MFHTELCDILKIRYPIIQGGMAWASDHRLAAAVSNAGGLGLIAGGNIPNEELRQEIHLARKLTDKPFGVNIVPIGGVKFEDRIKLVVEEGISIVATAFSDPTKPVIAELHKHPITVISVVPTVRLAKRVEKEGADIIVASGCEAGGHVGRISLLPLLPQIVDAVKVPVVATGGIGDARGFLAALALGACGIQMGTRFMASKECIIHPEVKKKILETNEEGTEVTGEVTGSPARCIKNELTRHWLEREKKEGLLAKDELQTLGLGKLRKGLIDGDITFGTIPAGQVCGLIDEIQSVAEIITGIIQGAEAIMDNLRKLAKLN